MPNYLYGTNDNYDLKTSHFLSALLRKFHEAKMAKSSFVEVWGTGNPLREFLHVDDLAEACYFLMKNNKETNLINIGTGKDLTIKALAELIKKISNYDGEIVWNKDKPDGTPRKLLDVAQIHQLGWKHNIELEEGIKKVYQSKFLKAEN